MNDIFMRIENASIQELQDIMAEIEERFAVAFPQWDVFYFAVPKGDPQKRKAYLQQAVAMLDKEIE